MRVRFLFFLLLCFLSAGAFAQDSECLANIRTGTFEYDANGITITVVRTKKKQIETYNNGQSKLVNKVEWISENEYRLTFVKQVNAPGCLKKGDVMRLKILHCSANSYAVEIKSEQCGNATTTITRVK